MKSWLFTIGLKPWLLRMGYLLGLASLPSMIIALWRDWPIFHEPYGKENLFTDLNPIYWLKEWIENMMWFPAGFSLGFCFLPLFFYLPYSWMKKPTLIKALLLLVTAIIFAPYFSLTSNLELWEMGLRPFPSLF